MSTKGTPRRTFRLPDDLAEQVELTIKRRNAWVNVPFSGRMGRYRPWTVTGFILAAIKEKLAKMERSRRPRSCRHGPADAGRPVVPNKVFAQEEQTE